VQQPCLLSGDCFGDVWLQQGLDRHPRRCAPIRNEARHLPNYLARDVNVPGQLQHLQGSGFAQVEKRPRVRDDPSHGLVALASSAP